MIKNVLIVVLTLIILWILIRIIYLKIKKEQYRKTVNETFGVLDIQIPWIRTEFSYGFPVIILNFYSYKDFELSKKKGLIADFRGKIQQIHSKMKDFDADRAIRIHY